MTYPFFQKIAKIHQKAWEVTPHVFHHPWHIYLMDFYPFFSSSQDFTFDFSMSHCYTRYRSEEISPHARRSVFWYDTLFDMIIWGFSFVLYLHFMAWFNTNFRMKVDESEWKWMKMNKMDESQVDYGYLWKCQWKVFDI